MGWILTAQEATAAFVGRRVSSCNSLSTFTFPAAGFWHTTVLDLATERARVVTAFIEEGRKAIREDGAHVLVPGCMSMAFLGVAAEAQAELAVPVLNPAAVALKLAELYVGSGLTHSKTGVSRFLMTQATNGATHRRVSRVAA